MSGFFATRGWERVITSKSVDRYKGRTPLKNNQINRVGFAVLGKMDGWRNFLCQIMATCKINIFIIRSTCCYYVAVLKDAICFRSNRKLELLNEYTNTRLDFYNHDSLQEL